VPKRRPPRSRRRRAQPLPPVGAAAAARPIAPRPVAVAAQAPERARETSVTRFSARDYTYVRRELVRIALLASAIVVAIIVLSFFLP